MRKEGINKSRMKIFDEGIDVVLITKPNHPMMMMNIFFAYVCICLPAQSLLFQIDVKRVKERHLPGGRFIM